MKYIERTKDRREIHDLFKKEGIVQVIPSSQQKQHDIIDLYVVTQFATIVFIKFSIQKQCILDPIKVNLKVKELLNQRVDKCHTSEIINYSSGGPGLTLLISEHSLLCQIRLHDEPAEPGQHPSSAYGSQNVMGDVGVTQDILNEHSFPTFIGLVQLQIDKPTELSVNN